MSSKTKVINTYPGFTIYFVIPRLKEISQKYSKKMIDEIIDKNNELAGYKYDGFYFHDKYYSNSTLPIVRQEKTVLHIELFPEIRKYLTFVESNDRDIKKIRMVLSTLFPTKSLEFQELVNILPDFIRIIVPEIPILERTKEEAYHIKEIPALYNQWLEVRELLEKQIAYKMVL